MNKNHRRSRLWGAVLGSLAMAAQAQTAAPKIAVNPLKNAYFGDLHLHTGMSFDAFLAGTRLWPEEGYRFARGEVIEVDGVKHQRSAPLDFLAVTDHSEYLGQMRLADDPAGPLSQTSWGKLFLNLSPEQRTTLLYKLSSSFGTGGEEPPDLLQEGVMKSNWQHQIDAAEKFYQPGKFTTFVAYEWSALPNGANLHRNVIFRGPKYPVLPFSSLDSAKPEALWRYLEHQRSLGIPALAIPHNSNVSDGLMFSYADSDRNPITREQAETRASIERLVEITQHKGSSETRPQLSPNDEFAGFEVIDNLLTVPRPSSIDGSYARQAYGRGLEIEQRTGVNPFQFGLSASSDYHTGLSKTDETEAPGYFKPGADVQRLLQDATTLRGVRVSAAGLTGAWAESNTREALYDALYRREVFATSGPRLRVRLFAGFDYPQGLTRQRDWLKRAYQSGVPMGADLPGANAKAAPRFLIHAVKDASGANLDRVQIVKVWLQNGASKEKVFDIAWSGERKPDAQGKLPAVGSSVNVEKATYTNDIGAVELLTEWQDPEFRADQPAVYYARVLEIPTPRWTTYLAVKNNLPVPTSVPPTLQERAWTSPVFYRP